MIAFMFPGQGSQTVGMGKAWAEGNPIAMEYFERANSTLGRDLRSICFEGPEEALTDTRNTQVAIYTVSCIAARLLFDLGLVPDYVAGHSIGEYAALYYARAFDFETGLKLVQERAHAMADAGAATQGTMAAVMRLDPATIEVVCQEIASSLNLPLSIAGYNSPEQTVISGAVPAIEKAMTVLKVKGAKRVIQLNVSGAFHSGLMQPAFEKFQQAVNQTDLKKPATLFISNHDASPVTEAATLYKHLPLQLISPVRWTATLAYLKAQGCQVYVETGPGTVLCGLLKKFDDAAPAESLTDLDSFKAVVERSRPFQCGTREKCEDLH